ncbi:MAG: hypothetical protein Fues2KO_00090 [Fuerstiella sp.]
MESGRDEIHEQFLSLFAANEPAIRAYVRRLVPTRHDAADVMQGVALVLWRKFDKLDDTKRFRRWAFGIAKYESLAWLRDKARSRLVLADDVLEVVAHESTREDERLSAQREALEDCLEKLPTYRRPRHAARDRVHPRKQRSALLLLHPVSYCPRPAAG